MKKILFILLSISVIFILSITVNAESDVYTSPYTQDDIDYVWNDSVTVEEFNSLGITTIQVTDKVLMVYTGFENYSSYDCIHVFYLSQNADLQYNTSTWTGGRKSVDLFVYAPIGDCLYWKTYYKDTDGNWITQFTSGNYANEEYIGYIPTNGTLNQSQIVLCYYLEDFDPDIYMYPYFKYSTKDLTFGGSYFFPQNFPMWEVTQLGQTLGTMTEQTLVQKLQAEIPVIVTTGLSCLTFLVLFLILPMVLRRFLKH